MNIHEHMAERIELAKIYAEDGAFHTAAGVLLELAQHVKAHAVKCDQAMAATVRKTPRAKAAS